MRPNLPGVNFVEDTGMSGADRPNVFDTKNWMQDFLDRNPDSPLAPRISAVYGIVPRSGGAAPRATGGVRVDITGQPGQDDYTVTHGPIGAPRGRPGPDDPFYQENFGVTDELTPWLIAPHVGGGRGMGGVGTFHPYGVPASQPIALPQMPPMMPAPMGPQRGEGPRRPPPSPAGQKGTPQTPLYPQSQR